MGYGVVIEENSLVLIKPDPLTLLRDYTRQHLEGGKDIVEEVYEDAKKVEMNPKIAIKGIKNQEDLYNKLLDPELQSHLLNEINTNWGLSEEVSQEKLKEITMQLISKIKEFGIEIEGF